jgi:hypothetical protein
MVVDSPGAIVCLTRPSKVISKGLFPVFVSSNIPPDTVAASSPASKRRDLHSACAGDANPAETTIMRENQRIGIP